MQHKPSKKTTNVKSKGHRETESKSLSVIYLVSDHYLAYVFLFFFFSTTVSDLAQQGYDSPQTSETLLCSGLSYCEYGVVTICKVAIVRLLHLQQISARTCT